MAPLADNNTGRIKVTYQNAIAEHTFLVRPRVGQSIPDVLEYVDNLLTALTPVISEITITAVDFSAVSTDIFLPVAGASLVDNVYGSSAATLDNNPVKVNFVGRSGGGRRVTFGVFGYKSTTSAYRVTTGEDTDIAATVELLNDVDAPVGAIDGLKPVWKAYADIKANDYWVGQSRG